MWKSASASGSPDSMLTGPSPDIVSSTVTACGSAPARALPAQPWRAGGGSAGTALFDEDGSCRATRRDLGRADRPGRAPSASCRVDFLGAGLGRGCALDTARSQAPRPAGRAAPTSSSASALGSEGPASAAAGFDGFLPPALASAPALAAASAGGAAASRRRARRRRFRTRLGAACRRRGRGCRTRLAGGRLALQRREFGVAHLEQAPASASSAFELLDARLRAGRTPRPACRVPASQASWSSGRRRRRALLRRYQAQPARLARPGGSRRRHASRQHRYCRATSAAAARRRKSALDLAARPECAAWLPERRTLMLPSNACGLFW